MTTPIDNPRDDDGAGSESRRTFLTNAAGSGVLLLAGCAGSAAASHGSRHATQPGPGDEEISVAEDLMREHGVLDRLLLVYEAARAQLAASVQFQAEPLHRAADLVRRFIEEYHEKLEEDHLFPRFERAGRLSDLVSVLKTQHAAGRRVTAEVLERTSTAAAPLDREGLSRVIDDFIRMYRPHAAREDTVLFPALRSIVSASELAELGERFEQIEHQRFGEAGFEGVVGEVAEIERSMGIHDLSQFTPQI
jgi:hemerythrin-like domain-containing protein